jgi:hypothetical protein
MTSTTDEIVAIRQTLSAYNIAGDRMKIDGLAATFMSNGILDTSTARFVGRQAIIDGLSRRDAPAGGPPGRRATVVRHNLTTSHSEVTGADTAEGRTYFIVFTDIGPDHMGCYVDKLRKVDGQWLFEHRRVLIDWLADDTLFGGLVENYQARKAAKGAPAA